MKTANLTVRIDPDLKRQAQEVAEFLDVSLSQAVTAALKGVIRQAAAHRSWLGEFAMPAPVQEAQEAGEAFADKAGRARVLDRISELQAKERRNELNKVTRRALAELLRLQMAW